MDRGDLITLAGGIAFVIVIAIIVKSGTIVPQQEQEIIPAAPVPSLPVTMGTPVPLTSVPTGTPAPDEPAPVQITYSRNPLDYPVIQVPDSMETFGSSEIFWKNPEAKTVAIMQGSRGGLSQEFTVPFELWGMNITVESWRKPQYARFDLVLCAAEDGQIIDGIEILNRGTAFKSVQVSGVPMYFIIQAENVDRFQIDIITPAAYYNKTQKRVSVQ